MAGQNKERYGRSLHPCIELTGRFIDGFVDARQSNRESNAPFPDDAFTGLLHEMLLQRVSSSVYNRTTRRV